jgi:hypothetical protein
MNIILTDLIQAWLSGERGVNYFLPFVQKADPSDPDPVAPHLIVSGFRDINIRQGKTPPDGSYPLIVVDILAPLQFTEANQGVGLAEDIVFTIGCMVKDADRLRSTAQACALGDAVIRSLDCLESGNGYPSASHRVRCNVSLRPRSGLTGALVGTSDKGITLYVIRATYDAIQDRRPGAVV